MVIVSDDEHQVVVDFSAVLGLAVNPASAGTFQFVAWFNNIHVPLAVGSEQRCLNGMTEVLRAARDGIEYLELRKALGPRPDIKVAQAAPADIDSILRANGGR